MKKVLLSLLVLVKLNCFSQDRLGAHFAVGSVIGGTSAFVFKTPKKAINTSLFVSTLAGVGKELYDKKSGGKFDTSDVGATVLGSVMTTSVILIVRDIRRRYGRMKYCRK